ncbi:MAG: M56 family metallopeptidase, partial [Egibacteraceae bacterium]
MTPQVVPGGTEGFFFSLLTESFAVRALLGTLVATGLAAVAVRWRVVRTLRARRLVVLVPVLVTLFAALLSLGDNRLLPQQWVFAPGPIGATIELPDELQVVATDLGLHALVLSWVLVAGTLLARRTLGLLAARRLLRRATPVPGDHWLAGMAAGLGARMGAPRVRLLLLSACPGGAFTTGTLRPLVAVDPALVRRLDDCELEGLIAHELAHVTRRDPLLEVLVGVVADLSFFLPTIHVVRGWFHREQEEGADEVAAHHTGRPGALASSILKVWDRVGPLSPPRGACAVVPPRLAVAGPGLLPR